MKTSKLGWGSAVLMLAIVAATPSHLAGQGRAVSVGVGGGVTVPTSSDYSDFSKSGWNVGGFVQWRQPNQVFGVRGEVQYHRTAMKDEYLQTFPNYTIGTTGDLGILHLGADAVMEVAPKSNSVGWYLLAGVGTYGIQFRTSYSGASASYTDNKVGFNAGGGLKFRAGTANLFAEARWHSVKDDDVTFSFVPISFGISW